MSGPLLHLLSVWNPSYASDAMDAHLDNLLDWSRRHAEGKAGEDDVFVWWAKVRSPNRQQPLPHKDDVLRLDAQVQAGTETHLYLTDYRSLYVADVGEITTDDVLKGVEADHAPRYYAERGYLADFWFRLWDIRRLVADDTVAVVEELRQLRNVRYNDRPVSIYGGIYELPLLVRRPDGEAGWFTDKDSLISERLWAERDGRLRGETERVSADLRDNVIGREVWPRLQIATRSFLATGEAIFRRHRDDPHFDFATAAIEYAKALEVELNSLLRPGLATIGESRHQSLGSLARTLKEPPQPVASWLAKTLGANKPWLTGQLAPQLGAIADLRNPGAHGETVNRTRASSIRDDVIGIGREGLLVRLARLRA